MGAFTENLMRLWNEWELRGLVLLSFSFQIILTLFGSFRKRYAAKWIVLLLWTVYILADSVASTALGVLAHNQGQSDSTNLNNNNNNQLLAFWSPFLLLHLGGPDTITAFSYQDNELWWRHLFRLVVQMSMASYVFFRSLVPGSHLWFLAIPMFVAGMIKCGERTWALRSASMDYCRDSVPPDRPVSDSGSDSITMGYDALHDAHRIFHIHIVQRFFFDLILSSNATISTNFLFSYIDWKHAFEVIEVEIQLMYDLLYTKVALLHTQIGSILRFITFSCISVVLMTFAFVVHKRGCLKIDIVITYILLGGAIFIEICQLVRLLFSHRIMIWLNEHQSQWQWQLVLEVVSKLRGKKEPAWPNSVEQLNLVRLCLKDKPTMFKRIRQFFRVNGISDKYDKYSQTTSNVVSDELKEFIFDEIILRSEDETELKFHSGGDWRFRSKNRHKNLENFEMEFDRSIILWHIATDLCYDKDSKSSNQVMTSHSDRIFLRNYQASKVLSEYLLYLLDTRSFVLSTADGRISFRHTCTEVKGFLHIKKSVIIEAQARSRLLGENIEIDPIITQADRDKTAKSVLRRARQLATSLNGYDMKQKWEIISGMWMEMLLYAASHCKGIYHVEQLNVGGGGLLTRAWLLMAHLGLTDHSQPSKDEMLKED